MAMTAGQVKAVEDLEAQQPGRAGKEGARVLSAEERRMRRNTTIAAMCLDAIPGLYVGSSPWLDFMNATVPPGMPRWLAPGVTQPAVFMTTGLCLYMPLLAHLLRRDVVTVRSLGFLAVLGMAFPLSIGLTAGGAGFWVQYAGAAVGGVGLVAAQFVEKIVAVQWWALTGDAAKGAAMMGCSVGLWSTAFTLLSAGLCEWCGLARTMCVLAGVIFLATLFPLWLACRGELEAPPADAMRSSAAAEAAQEGAQLGGARQEFSTRRTLCSLRFWQLLFHFTAIFFFGFGQKALLSPIFQTTYDVTYLQSAYFAAFVLAVYAAMRAGLPLLTRRLPLVPVNVGLLSLSAVLYACCPAVVRELPIAWLIAASTLTGASFAGTSTLRNLLALEMYGAADLANVLPLLEVGVGLGKFVGPVTGYYIYLADAEGGDESHSAYDPFFYACAAVAALDAANMLLLHARSRRSVAAPARGA